MVILWRKKPLSLVCPVNTLRSLVLFLGIDCPFIVISEFLSNIIITLRFEVE